MISIHRQRIVVLCGLAVTLLAIAQCGSAAAHSRHAQASQVCPFADAPVNSEPVATMRAAVVCLTNQERNAHGLSSLRVSVRLTRVAQSLTQTMIATAVFGHGPNFTLRFSASGYDWQAAAENIAMGYTTPRSVVAGWMSSPDHCRNILSPAFRDVGVGAVPAAAGAWDAAPGTWAEDLGLLMSQSAPSHNTGPQSGCPY